MSCIMKIILKSSPILTVCFLLLYTNPCLAEIQLLEDKPVYALSIYGGQMTDNSIDDFTDSFHGLDFEESSLLTLALARRIATHSELASFEVEGQVVKHFDQQNHWEFNALLAARWEAFFWDKYLDTSFAVGVGPSYAADVPEIEVQRSGESKRLQVYLMVELEFVLPSHPNVAVITRIHHRSNAFGIVADSGTSNAFAFGLKFRI
ncbi:MAG: hypothetical protein GQ578_04390 [Desulfuromonadaceae bacterium]|nr:hypothetical protein [Desulfuromonadaceae bacterium]